jgi:hypothetical protein
MPTGTAHEHAHLSAISSLGMTAGPALAAVGVHTLVMLSVTGGVALAVYEWVGLAFLRRSWINLDLVWAIVLIGAGLILLVMSLL